MASRLKAMHEGTHPLMRCAIHRDDEVVGAKLLDGMGVERPRAEVAIATLREQYVGLRTRENHRTPLGPAHAEDRTVLLVHPNEGEQGVMHRTVSSKSLHSNKSAQS